MRQLTKHGQDGRVQGVREDDQDEEQGVRVSGRVRDATAAAAAARVRGGRPETAEAAAQGRFLAQGQGRGQRRCQTDRLPEPALQGLHRRAVVRPAHDADGRRPGQDRRRRAAHHQDVRTTGQGAQGGGGGQRRRPAGRPPAADRALRRVAAQVGRQAVRRDQGDAGRPVRRVRDRFQAEQPGVQRRPATAAQRTGRSRRRWNGRGRAAGRRRPAAVRRPDGRRTVARRAADVRGREHRDVQRIEPTVHRSTFLR